MTEDRSFAFPLLVCLALAPLVLTDARAGSVEPGTQLKGISSPFTHVSDQKTTPRLWVFQNNKGIPNAKIGTIPVKNPRNVTVNLADPTASHESVVADFRSALEILGVRMQINGVLEVQENKGDPKNPIYAIYPREYSIEERPEEFINLTAIYGKFEAPAGLPDLILLAHNDSEWGKKFSLLGLGELLAVSELSSTACRGIESLRRSPSHYRFKITREEKMAFRARFGLRCSEQADDEVKVDLRIRRDPRGLRLTVTADRPNHGQATAEFVRP